MKGKIIITALEPEENAESAGDGMHRSGTRIDTRMSDVTPIDKIALAAHLLEALQFSKMEFLALTSLYLGVGPVADACKKN